MLSVRNYQLQSGNLYTFPYWPGPNWEENPQLKFNIEKQKGVISLAIHRNEPFWIQDKLLNWFGKYFNPSNKIDLALTKGK